MKIKKDWNKLQKILKLKRKSTIDNLNLNSNLLLKPILSKSQQNNNSNGGVSVSSQSDLMSALGYRNEMRKTSTRMQSIILWSPTLNKSEDPRRATKFVRYLLIKNSRANKQSDLAATILSNFQEQTKKDKEEGNILN